MSRLKTKQLRVPPDLLSNLRAIQTILFIAFLITGAIAQCQTFNDPGFVAETLFSVQPFKPVFLKFAPDGRIFIVEKDGVVRIFENGSLLPTPFLNISSKVNIAQDRGLLGFALDPDFETNGFSYLLYTYEDGPDPNSTGPKTARLTRVTVSPTDPNVASPESEVVLLGSVGTPPCPNNGNDCIPSDGVSHTIGTLRFAPDGNLFVGIGDGASFTFVDQLAFRSQDLNSYSGKILRIRTDGSAPLDNPFYDGTNSIQSRVWSYGLRNPYRFDLDPLTGEPMIGDVGWKKHEEINRAGRGRNFGWPCYEGIGPQAGYAVLTQCQQLSPNSVTPPLYTYVQTTNNAVIGGAFYTSNAYPNKYQGNFFFADYVEGWIKRIEFDSNGNMVDVQPFATDAGSVVNLELGPDGLLYYIEFGSGAIRRIKFNGPLAKASATPLFGYSPLNVTFSSVGSIDPTGSPITYLWDFDENGQTSTSPGPVHSFMSSVVKTFNVRLTVTNQSAQTSSDVVKVTVGSIPPTATIDTPAGGIVLKGGEVVNFQGSATDSEDGLLDPSALNWDVLFHHEDHVHTFLNKTGAQGSFTPANFYGEGNYAFEIILTATDTSGLSDRKSILLPFQNLLFDDDFSDGNASDWMVIKDAWTVVANKLTGTTASKAEIQAPTPWMPSTEVGCSSCSIETDFQLDSKEMQIFLLAWYQDKKNYVQVKVIGDKGKISIKQKVNGKAAAKGKAAFPIQVGTTYRFRVDFSQNAFHFYIDDVLIATAPTSSAPFGNLRLRLKSGSNAPATAHFGNIQIF